MVWTCETPAAKADRPQPKISAVLLNHHVGSDFGRTKYAVHRTIDAHVFRDPIRIRMVRVDIEPQLPLDERQPIGKITVNLVRRGENEHRFWRMLPCRLEQVQCSRRID